MTTFFGIMSYPFYSWQHGFFKMVYIDSDAMKLYLTEIQNVLCRNKLLESLSFSNIELEALKSELLVFNYYVKETDLQQRCLISA